MAEAEATGHINAAPRIPGPVGVRRRAAALTPKKEQESLRAQGQGGSSSTMMRLYTQDEAVGLKVDPVIVLSLAVVFIFSVVFLHLATRAIRWYSK